MEKLEQLFNDITNIDSKCILNRCELVIKQQDLDIIESEGATIEILEALNVPVFKYNTQITIHGLFPELFNNRIGGYKNLFQNKNKSIGVKYNAVDYNKKIKIYKILEYFGFSYTRKSDSFYTNLMIKTTRENYKTDAQTLKDKYSNINKSLFYGNTYINLWNYWGQLYLSYTLNINAIYEKNINAFLESFLNMPYSEIEEYINKIDLERAKKESEEQAAKDAIKQAHEAKKQAFLNIHSNTIKEAKDKLNFVKHESDFKIIDGLIHCHITFNIETSEIFYNFTKYTKTKQQKQFRFKQIKININDFVSINDLDFSNSYESTLHHKDSIKGLLYLPANQTEQTKNIKQPEPVKKDAKITIIDYSDKALAVIGNTYEYKKELSELGGRFNKFLSCGAGWIFPKSKKEQILKLI